jgi:mannose-6-phosphate isomerase-like protein (cupin superfamily)
MILKAAEIEEKNGRRPYEWGESALPVHHFVTRVTTPDNPFQPHQHTQPELWFILAGDAVVELDGVESAVSEGDLIMIEPQVRHGLRTESQVKWICLG